MKTSLGKLAGVAAAVALCLSPTMVTAATTASAQPISPLIAVSLYGTQASAQQVCGNAAAVIGAAGAAAAAQGPAKCVLPATDAPPPPMQSEPPPPPSPPGSNYGINWLLAGLGLAALIGGLSTLFADDDDAVSPA